MKQNDMTKPFDVIVIGGGATGAGIARDCARRGIRVLLIERFDISTGATGRNHGLLHSGARYAVIRNRQRNVLKKTGFFGGLPVIVWKRPTVCS